MLIRASAKIDEASDRNRADAGSAIGGDYETLERRSALGSATKAMPSVTKRNNIRERAFGLT